jgi:hypothetical protein
VRIVGRPRWWSINFDTESWSDASEGEDSRPAANRHTAVQDQDLQNLKVALIDSGATTITGPEHVVREIYQQLELSMNIEIKPVPKERPKRYMVPCDASFPPMRLTFEDVTYEIPYRQLILRLSTTQCCGALSPAQK